ncbi:MAG: GNAT family N-acetyltransferase [Methylacidiphilaceae bacterium]|nr:GNAT family N-acetyltransferase [Candidatus Methylacidiphilaceae bacterium]
MAGEPNFGMPQAVSAAPASSPLSIEEFLRLPREFGWSYQHVDGCSLRTPQVIPIPARISTAQKKEASLAGVREPGPGDKTALADLYQAAFVGSRSYFGWGEDEVAEDAWHSVESFYEGERGEPDPSSRIALDSEGLAGAALVVRHREVPTLYLLFVSPARHRRGIGGALIIAVLQALRASGAPFLRSAFDGGDAAARAWYRAVGFVEEPSLPVALARLAWLRGEWERRGGSEEEGVAWRQEMRQLSDAIRCLTDLAKAKGSEAVYPDLTVWQRRWWPKRLRGS